MRKTESRNSRLKVATNIPMCRQGKKCSHDKVNNLKK